MLREDAPDPEDNKETAPLFHHVCVFFPVYPETKEGCMNLEPHHREQGWTQ